jgi:hypothetical protein
VILAQLACDARRLSSLLYEVRLDQGAEKVEDREKTILPHPIQSEKLAEIAAIELMYPFKYRPADRAAIDAGTTTLRALAVHFHAPEYVIGTALHDKHFALAQEFWNKVNHKKA